MGILLIAACLFLAGDIEDSIRLLGESDPDKRVRGIRGLHQEGSLEAARALLSTHSDPHPRVRRKAAQALGEIRDPKVRTWVIDSGLAHREASARRMAVEATGKSGDPRAVPALTALLEDPSEAVRAAAVRSLARLGASSAASRVALRLAVDRAWKVRAEAALALGEIGGPDHLPHLLGACKDGEGAVRLAALQGVHLLDGQTGTGQAIRALRDPDWRTRCTASEILGRTRSAEVVTPLIDALGEARGRTVRDVLGALRRVTGRSLGADPGPWRIWWEANRGRWRPPTEGGDEEARTSSVVRVTYYDIPVWSDRVVFVLDLSESMGDPAGGAGSLSRADRAREELRSVLSGMGRGSRFNIVVFRSGVEVLSPRPVPPTRGNCEILLRRLGRPRGGTNLYDALEVAIREGGGDTVFLLSDGAPSCGTYRNKTEILEAIAELNRFRKIRIHTIGIGSQAVSERWKGLLDGLAEMSDGESVTRRSER